MTACARCGREVACLDEHDRCEQCVIAAHSIVCGPLTSLEAVVDDLVGLGLSADQIRRAVELSLTNAIGVVDGAMVARCPTTTGERGVWGVEPGSAWLDGSRSEPNRIRGLRRSAGMSREGLADHLAVTETAAARRSSCAAS